MQADGAHCPWGTSHTHPQTSSHPVLTLQSAKLRDRRCHSARPENHGKTTWGRQESQLPNCSQESKSPLEQRRAGWDHGKYTAGTIPWSHSTKKSCSLSSVGTLGARPAPCPVPQLSLSLLHPCFLLLQVSEILLFHVETFSRQQWVQLRTCSIHPLCNNHTLLLKQSAKAP